ncbi:transposase [Micromonospora sp. NPDC023737]|uniref:transposase n=1 Tax=unclassified Micromonospora TaxID=2617518 RepID=UPI0033EAE59E
MLEYKAARNGRTFARVHRFFPSTRMCSNCGRINEKMTLNVRAWDCRCGAAHDRDVNAAINVLARRAGGQRKRPWSARKTGTRPGTAQRSGNPPGRRVFHAQRGGNLRPLGRRGCQRDATNAAAFPQPWRPRWDRASRTLRPSSAAAHSAARPTSRARLNR